jgi:hypothetical protein
MQNIRHKPDARDEYGEGSMVGDDHALDALRYGAMVLHMRRPRVQDQKLWWRDYGHRQRTRDVMRRNEIHAGGGSCLG